MNDGQNRVVLSQSNSALFAIFRDLRHVPGRRQRQVGGGGGAGKKLRLRAGCKIKDRQSRYSGWLLSKKKIFSLLITQRRYVHFTGENE